MDDFVLILYTLLLAGGATVITMVVMRYQMDLMISEIDTKIAAKLKTFPATMARSMGSQREPGTTETILGLVQAFMAMKAEGYSIKDIMSEFGGTVVEETIKEAVKPAETS